MPQHEDQGPARARPGNGNLHLPLAFAPGRPTLQPSKVTRCPITNAAVIGAFTGAEVRINGEIGEPAVVEIAGQG